jgi:hypothetical protein
MILENLVRPAWQATKAVAARAVAFGLATITGGIILSTIMVWLLPRSVIDERIMVLVAMVSLGFASGSALLRFLRIGPWIAVAVMAVIASAIGLGIGDVPVWEETDVLVAQLVAFFACASTALSAISVFVYNRVLHVLIPGTTGATTNPGACADFKH